MPEKKSSCLGFCFFSLFRTCPILTDRLHLLLGQRKVNMVYSQLCIAEIESMPRIHSSPEDSFIFFPQRT
ncbi:uncharacterized protein FFB20_15043 [Fusarium fujikuroi]|uniref:Uncharacterized protein n=1 Tax=Fusarium fujikuroi TaxID=5127 RepID=A0A2H3S476_FUSFU|nr:uncharacterized protein FFE2_05086 [Fusarium fujikuroi]SCN84447.1 uncharacterized protein FFC1_04557 [Fusarium fujikuroi]SCN85091.1 uncharacterized protein FFM5_03576 [Fusarium fujikuroi]SCO16665.1 uncharacterized protein FFB20_15043 [Fusarium fujikuroi]SCO34629.1 uncharacterized protein FFNC_03944 [Fusarium fujikuroi]